MELFNSRSFVSRSKVNNFTTSNYRNNTYISCSLISVNKIFLFLLLFSVLFFIKDNVSKNNRQLLVSILFSTSLFFVTILLIPFDFFFGLLVSLNRKPNEALSICHWNLNSISAHHFAKLNPLKAYVSSNINEVIRVILTLFSFYKKISHTKSTKSTKN